MKPIAFGIDFGTTNSLLSVGGEMVNATKPIPLWAENKKPHPSVVWYRLDEKPCVGFEAKTNMTEMNETLGNRFYRSIKRELGKNRELELPGQLRVPASRIAGDIFKHLKRHYLDSAVNLNNSQNLMEAVQAELINHVLMVGGSSNIPAIRRRMEDLFGSRVEIADEPDAAISRGAAVVAAEGWVPFAARKISVKLSDDSYFPVLEQGVELISSQGRRYSFFCVDPRPGDAYFWFYDHPNDGQGKPSKIDSFLSIPVNPSISSVAELGKDRLVCDFSISENLTLRCNGKSSSVGIERATEIFDIHFGLRIA